MAENPQKIGAAIRRVRTLRSISPDDLAEKVGVTKNYLCQLEVGSKGCSDETLQRIAHALDVPSSILRVVSEETPENAKPQVKKAHRALQELAWDLLEGTLPKINRKL